MSGFGMRSVAAAVRTIRTSSFCSRNFKSVTSTSTTQINFVPEVDKKHTITIRTVSGSSSNGSSQPVSPFATTTTTSKTETTKRLLKQRKQKFVPLKAAVQLTENARIFFKKLLAKPPRPEIIGIMLNYSQSNTGEPRMVFHFSFVTPTDLHPQDEGVSLEVVRSNDDGSSKEEWNPKSPKDAATDGLPKLYVNHNAFIKVLGAKLDVDESTITPILYDREGNTMDPNIT